MTTEERESKSADWRRDNLGKNVGLANVSNCYGCKKEYTDRDKEHGMCHKCWEPIIEK